jgi:hypothetical protein
MIGGLQTSEPLAASRVHLHSPASSAFLEPVQAQEEKSAVGKAKVRGFIDIK